MVDEISAAEIEAAARALVVAQGKDPDQMWPGTRTPAKTRPQARWKWHTEDARKILAAAAAAKGEG